MFSVTVPVCQKSCVISTSPNRKLARMVKGRAENVVYLPTVKWRGLWLCQTGLCLCDSGVARTGEMEKQNIRAAAAFVKGQDVKGLL